MEIEKRSDALVRRPGAVSEDEETALSFYDVERVGEACRRSQWGVDADIELLVSIARDEDQSGATRIYAASEIRKRSLEALKLCGRVQQLTAREKVDRVGDEVAVKVVSSMQVLQANKDREAVVEAPKLEKLDEKGSQEVSE